MEVQRPQLTRNCQEKCVRGEKPNSVTTTPISEYQSTRRFPITSIINFYKTHDCKRQKNMLFIEKFGYLVTFGYAYPFVFFVPPRISIFPLPHLLHSEFYPSFFSPPFLSSFIFLTEEANRDFILIVEWFPRASTLHHFRYRPLSSKPWSVVRLIIS